MNLDRAQLIPMHDGDIAAVVDIIDSHDEDDAEEAQASFERLGTDHFHVLTWDGEPVGVTGIRPINGADHSAWLSWTYVHDDHVGKGLGRYMLESLFAKLREHQARMLFVAVSDYVDPEDGAIYAAAMHLYRSLGFVESVVNPDFYAPGENQYLLSLRLATEAAAANNIAAEKPGLELCRLDEIAETEGSFFIDWQVEGNKVFTAKDLQLGIDSAAEQQARAVYITFPSNLPDVAKPLRQAGFSPRGQLKDYYEDGLHEDHYVYQF